MSRGQARGGGEAGRKGMGGLLKLMPAGCGSEAWYEGNFSAMLRCVDLSRGLLETPGPTGNILMQLKVTALTSARLCVRDGQDGGGRVGLPTSSPSPLHPPPHSRRS